MMAALLVVIAIAFWSRSSWVFLVVGGLTLVLTNGRASIGAAAAGVVILVMFSRNPRLARLPRTLRIIGGSVVLVAGALIMFARPAGLTGREKIWPAFLELWSQSPLLGVGGTGIANGNEVAQFYGHAHSLYIDELARWGLVGFLAQFAAVGIGVYIAARAAGFGFPGPLAVIVTYLITGVTEPRNDWIAPSATGFLLILMVLAASASLQKRDPQMTQPDHPECDDGSSRTIPPAGEPSPGEAHAPSRR
jgi:Lipid A core - O-antigen ligase and related enzymes